MSKAAWKYSKAPRVCHLYDRFQTRRRRVSTSRWKEQTPWNIHLKSENHSGFHISLAMRFPRFRIFAIIDSRFFTRAATIYLLISLLLDVSIFECQDLVRYIYFFDIDNSASFDSSWIDATNLIQLESILFRIVCSVELIFKMVQFHRIVIFYIAL